jgi:FdhD protein
MPVRASATVSVRVFSVEGSYARAKSDDLVVEEPLEIRVCVATAPAPGALAAAAGRPPAADAKTLSVTMRTPGAEPQEDVELALGFLFSEGLLRQPSDLLSAAHADSDPNVVVVTLAPGTPVAWDGLLRHVYTTSACGVCGKTALTALAAEPAEPLRPAEPAARIEPPILHGLSTKLRAAQAAFNATGGLHAAGLFDGAGRLLLAREDVGRHNAVDKLLGARFLAWSTAATTENRSLPLHGLILCVSGRASFELVQKARMACVPIFVAVGAPSSMALELARESGMTLVGFARDGRCNVYAAPERLALQPASVSLIPHS